MVGVGGAGVSKGVGRLSDTPLTQVDNRLNAVLYRTGAGDAGGGASGTVALLKDVHAGADTAGKDAYNRGGLEEGDFGKVITHLVKAIN